MRRRAIAAASVLSAALMAAGAVTGPAAAGDHGKDRGAATSTPIKHLVVVFQENVSFDHYFGTYPKAANTDGTPFTAAPERPRSTD